MFAVYNLQTSRRSAHNGPQSSERWKFQNYAAPAFAGVFDTAGKVHTAQLAQIQTGIRINSPATLAFYTQPLTQQSLSLLLSASPGADCYDAKRIQKENQFVFSQRMEIPGFN